MSVTPPPSDFYPDVTAARNRGQSAVSWTGLQTGRGYEYWVMTLRTRLARTPVTGPLRLVRGWSCHCLIVQSGDGRYIMQRY